MTKNELIHVVYTQGHRFCFSCRGEKYDFGFVPTGNDEIPFEELIIGRAEVAEEAVFNSIDEMLENYLIGGVPLLELLPEIHDMQGIPAV